MVTGDDVLAGAAIAKQLGNDGDAILGADFPALSEPELSPLVKAPSPGTEGVNPRPHSAAHECGSR